MSSLNIQVWAAFIAKLVYFGLLLIRSSEYIRRDKRYFLKVFFFFLWTLSEQMKLFYYIKLYYNTWRNKLGNLEIMKIWQVTHKIRQNIFIKDNMISGMLYRNPTWRFWFGSPVQHDTGGKSVLILWDFLIAWFVLFLIFSILYALSPHFHHSCHPSFMHQSFK